MDWSLDNIVADDDDKVTFIDLEDVVVLDKQIAPNQDLPDWYKRYGREDMGPGFSFSIQNMCRHHLSDHNLWAACYTIFGDEKPLLTPVPKHVDAKYPQFVKLLLECLNGSDRFRTVSLLQKVIADMLGDEAVVGVGVVR